MFLSSERVAFMSYLHKSKKQRVWKVNIHTGYVRPIGISVATSSLSIDLWQMLNINNVIEDFGVIT